MKLIKPYSLVLFFIAEVLILNPVVGQAPEYRWVRTLADSTNGDSSGAVAPLSIKIDPISGAVYTVGAFEGTVDFDPGAGVFMQTTNDLTDMFISKVDSNGSFIWAASFIGDSGGAIDDIIVDPNNGDIYIVGEFTGTVDMDPGPDSFNLISNGSYDIFVSKLSISGNLFWAKSMGGVNIEGTSSAALDEQGNIVITGYFSDVCDFDPGIGEYNLTSNGDEDIYICKLNSAGNFTWAKQVGGQSGDGGWDIAIDQVNSENIVIVGEFSNTCDFDPGPGTFNISAVGATDVFILKLNTAGLFLWAKAIGGGGNEEIYGIAINQSDGSINITGYFNFSVDFDPGPGTFYLNSAGIWDIFVSKLDVNGNFIWAKGMGGSSLESSSDIALDASGNIYATGLFWSTCDFDPGPDIFNLTALGNDDAFVLKLSPTGSLLWAKAFSGVNKEFGSSIAIDETGTPGLYTTGFTWRITDFDPGPTTFNLGNSNDEYTEFISKLNLNGDFVWAKAIGVEEEAFGEAYTTSIESDSLNGNIFASGTFTGKIDFDPGVGALNLFSAFSADAFVLKLNADGQLIWVKSFGAPHGYIFSCTMTRNKNDGSLYLAGGFYGMIDFDPGPGTFYLHSETGNGFICKLNSDGNFLWAKVFSGTGAIEIASIFIDNVSNIYTTGGFYSSIDFDPGAGVYNLVSNGGEDIFISKLDNSGNFLWAKSMGGTLTLENDIIEKGTSIVVDNADGAVYTTGVFDWTPVDFDPGPGTFIIETGAYVNMFILKLNAAGNFVWAKAFSGEGWTVGNSIEISSVSHHVLTTGYFSDRIDFDPGPSVFNLFPIGISDAFISSLDSAGNFVFAKAVGGTGFDEGNSIVINNWVGEHIYITGSFEETVDFDPGGGIVNINSEGSDDMFLLKCDDAGNYNWVKQAGGTLSESGVAITRGNSADVHWTGGFYSPTIGFDSINFTNSLPYTRNSFIAKIGQCSTVVTSAEDGGNGSLRDVISCISNGGTITFSIPPMSQISLTSGEIQIDKNLTLLGPGVYSLTLSGNDSNRIFNLLPGHNLTIENMSLKDATAIINGGAIYAQGNLSLENITFENNFQNGIPKALTIKSGALLNINGNVEFKY